MDSQQHTQGIVISTEIKEIKKLGWESKIMVKDTMICSVWGDTQEECNANAARIVEAWNEFDSLRGYTEYVKRMIDKTKIPMSYDAWK